MAELGPFVEKQNDELLQAKKNRSKSATLEKFDTWLRKAKLKGFVNVELEEKYVPKKPSAWSKPSFAIKDAYTLMRSKNSGQGN